MSQVPVPPPAAPVPRLWDVFCRVIDNHGDVGVCWRLSADLAQRGERVRLWVDDASALTWMAPHGHPGVTVLPWCDDPLACSALGADPAPADVVIEAFGCELPARYQAGLRARATPAVWINLEYLSAEPHVERLHGLPSPVLSGPAQGLTKWFFYPGFTPRTGGLIREAALNLPRLPMQATGERRILLFCYEPPSLGPWLAQLEHEGTPTRLRVTAGRAQAALADLPLPPMRHVQLELLNWVDQPSFDTLLSQSNFNCVRGEDSLVRAIWAGKPFVWQIYPQSDGAHHRKLEAFLDLLDAPAVVRQAHRAWNADTAQTMPSLTPEVLTLWSQWVQAVRTHLQAQTDLTRQLMAWAAAKG